LEQGAAVNYTEWAGVHRIGLISDTHGLMRSEAVSALQGVELILHAGDIGKPQILEQLQAIAPVLAVRGNNDQGEWAEAVPEHQLVEVETGLIYVLHDVKALDLDPTAAGIQAVISGHSHRSSVQERAGVLFVNPGSAGPRRFKLPVSVGVLQVGADGLRAELVELSV